MPLARCRCVLCLQEVTLRETKAPTGYSLSTLSHRVEVAASSDGVSVSVDGKTGADSHNLSVTDYPVGTTGTIVLSKTVVGDGADHTKPFEFTVTFSDNSTHHQDRRC